jgi:hypothetical protein
VRPAGKFLGRVFRYATGDNGKKTSVTHGSVEQAPLGRWTVFRKTVVNTLGHKNSHFIVETKMSLNLAGERAVPKFAVNSRSELINCSESCRIY